MLESAVSDVIRIFSSFASMSARVPPPRLMVPTVAIARSCSLVGLRKLSRSCWLMCCSKLHQGCADLLEPVHVAASVRTESRARSGFRDQSRMATSWLEARDIAANLMVERWDDVGLSGRYSTGDSTQPRPELGTNSTYRDLRPTMTASIGRLSRRCADNLFHSDLSRPEG